MSGPVWIRSKEVCFLEGDWWNFGLALQEAFPAARYYREPDCINRAEDRPQTAEPPELPLRSHVLDTESGPYDTVKMVFDPDWRPRYRRISTEIGKAPEDWYWSLSAPSSLPYAAFRLGGRIYDEPVPHPFKGDVHFYHEPHNKGHTALAGRFYRIFAKHATNRKGLVNVRVPSLEVTAPVGKGSPSWCGYHAIEWARQNPNGVLFYARVGFGIRPTADVKPFPAASARNQDVGSG